MSKIILSSHLNSGPKRTLGRTHPIISSFCSIFILWLEMFIIVKTMLDTIQWRSVHRAIIKINKQQAKRDIWVLHPSSCSWFVLDWIGHTEQESQFVQVNKTRNLYLLNWSITKTPNSSQKTKMVNTTQLRSFHIKMSNWVKVFISSHYSFVEKLDFFEEIHIFKNNSKQKSTSISKVFFI